MPSPPFVLIVAAEMERLKVEMLAKLNRDLFRAEAVPLFWRRISQPSRWWVRWQRVRAYLLTLWRALKGDDPYDVESDW